MQRLRWIPALVALAAGSVTARDAASPPAASVVEVQASDVTPSTVTGRIEVIDEVELIARVDGFLEARSFVQGGLVEAGDLLFGLVKRRFEARSGEADADIATAWQCVDELRLTA